MFNVYHTILGNCDRAIPAPPEAPTNQRKNSLLAPSIAAGMATSGFPAKKAGKSALRDVVDFVVCHCRRPLEIILEPLNVKP